MPPQGMPPQGGQLPEDQGIAQLPAPNIQNMAGGGIVAFADGGYTNEDMMNSSEPVVRMAYGGEVKKYSGQAESLVRTTDGGKSWWLDVPSASRGKPSIASSLADKKFASRAEAIAAFDAIVGGNTPTKELILPYGQTKATNVLGDMSAPVPPPPAPPPKAAAAPGPRPTAGPAATGLATLKPEDYRTQMDSFMPKEIIDPFAPERIDIAAAEKRAKEKQLTEFEKEVTERGVLGAKQEERIGKREIELGKDKELNTNMSIIEAGLAMMQSKGRGLAGIAEGAGVGTKMYASGLQRLRGAQEKIDEARDNLETLRRNEASMTSRERRVLRNEIENTTVSAKKDALAGLQQAYGIDKQDARTFFTTAEAANQKQLDRQMQKQIAGMPSGQMQVLSALGGGNIETGLRLMTEIQAGKKTMAQAYESYVVAMAGKDTTINPALTPQQFAAQIKTIQMLDKGIPGAIDGKADRK